MGRTHGASGAAAGLAVGLAASGPEVGLVCGAVGYVAAFAPDLDHLRATATKVLGPAGWLACRLLRAVSTSLGLPAHRGFTHTALFALLVGTAAAGVSVLWLGPRDVAAVGVAAAAGVLAALLGDWATRSSLPLLWWPLTRDGWCPPRHLRCRTGGPFERWLALPTVSLLAVALGVATVMGGVA